MDIYPTPAEVLRDAIVDRPVLGFRPHAAARAAKWFVDHFPGETLYAVKANDSPAVLNTLFDAGIRHFDVASVTEMRTMAKFPGAIMHIMHPVKSRRFIAEAYHDFGVRTFALDSEDGVGEDRGRNRQCEGSDTCRSRGMSFDLQRNFA